METEIWKSLPDVPGVEISTLGNVRTLDRVISSEKMTCFKKGRILKQQLHHNGYLRVGFYVNGKNVHKLVHRLVAQTFIPNPNGLPEVNHKDGDRTNNNVDNIEWCTSEYNIAYREKFGKALNRPVFAINLATLEVSQFCSQNEAGRELGVNQGNITGVVKGKLKHAGSYWFVNDDGHAVDIVKSKLHDIGKTGLKI